MTSVRKSKSICKSKMVVPSASAPGGTDFACAKESGIAADLVLGIPGRFSPKASAYILARAIERFTLREGKEMEGHS